MESEGELEGDGDGVGHRQRGKETRRKEGRLYHDITPLLCHYVSEQHSSSLMLRAVRGGQSRGRGGMWGVRVSEMEFLNSKWGSHMLSECDQPMNLTRYHNLPHLNLESRTSSTSYSSWSLMMMGPGCGGCGCSAMLSGM